MKYITLRLLIATALFFTGSLVTAGEPKIEPLKANTSDVLKFLGAHAWKWTYQPATPYKEITVRLVQFTRTPSGEFTRNEFSADSSGFQEPHTSDDILIVCGSKGGHATFVVSFGYGTSGPQEQASVSLTDYNRSGSGDGGLPYIIGSEYMLLTRFKDHKSTDNKDDLVSYVAVEIETK
jgi:hypothetical protein